MKKHWVKTLLVDREAILVPEALSELTNDLAAQSPAAHAPTHAPAGSDPLPVMVASGTGHAVGQTPDTPASAGTEKFLREDATWTRPPGSNRYAEFYGTDLAAITLTTAASWYLIAGLTVGEFSADITGATSAERSDFTVALDGMFLLNIHASVIEAATIDLLHMGVFLNGALVSKLQTSLETDTAEEAFSITGLIALRANDVLEVKLMGATNGVSVVVKHIDFNIVQVGY